jgi:hypothetical protein
MQLQTSTKHINNQDINIDDDGATPPLPPHLDGDKDNKGQGSKWGVYGGNFDDNRLQ